VNNVPLARPIRRCGLVAAVDGGNGQHNCEIIEDTMRGANGIMYYVAGRRTSLVPVAWACASSFLLLGAVGCNRGPHTVPVSGRVTYEGEPVGANPKAMFPASISFLPTQSGEGAPLRPASCVIDSEGKYELSSFSANDGVQPGEYNVVIVSILSGPTLLEPNKPEVWEIPQRYGRPGDSGLKVTIPDQRARLTFDFDLEP